MMLVKDVIDMAKIGAIQNLVISKNENAIMKFIYLGVSELYRKFNLSIKVESINTNPDLALYELRSKDVSLLLSVYNSDGQELRQTDVMGGVYDYKIINYRSFLLRQPRHDLLFAIYKASPIMFTSIEDEVELPDAMIEALLTYVAYMGNSTINKDNKNETAYYAQKFEETCKDLDNQGYKVVLNTESINLRLKGYV